MYLNVEIANFSVKILNIIILSFGCEACSVRGMKPVVQEV